MVAPIQQVSDAEYETLARLRYSLRQFLRFSEEVARAAGITPQKHQALLAIRGFSKQQDVTIGDLAEKLQVRHHSAVGLVDRLEAGGFVTRKQSMNDRRQMRVRLTARSEKVLEKLSTAHKEQLRRVGPGIESLLKRFHSESDESGVNSDRK